MFSRTWDGSRCVMARLREKPGVRLWCRFAATFRCESGGLAAPGLPLPCLALPRLAMPCAFI